MNLLLTIEQVAQRAQFCRNTIKKAIQSGELRHGKFGRLIRIKASDADDWIERKIAGTMRSQRGSGVDSDAVDFVEKTVSADR